MPQLKQTTSLQDIKERLQVSVDEMKAVTNWEVGYRTALENVIKDIDAQGLRKERQDLITAHHDGQLDGVIKTPSLKDAEDYYTNTFKQ